MDQKDNNHQEQRRNHHQTHRDRPRSRKDPRAIENHQTTSQTKARNDQAATVGRGGNAKKSAPSRTKKTARTKQTTREKQGKTANQPRTPHQRNHGRSEGILSHPNNLRSVRTGRTHENEQKLSNIPRAGASQRSRDAQEPTGGAGRHEIALLKEIAGGRGGEGQIQRETDHQNLKASDRRDGKEEQPDRKPCRYRQTKESEARKAIKGATANSTE